MGLYSASVSTNPQVNAYSQQLFVPLIPISTNSPILLPHPPVPSLTDPPILSACFHYFPSTPACIWAPNTKKNRILIYLKTEPNLDDRKTALEEHLWTLLNLQELSHAAESRLLKQKLKNIRMLLSSVGINLKESSSTLHCFSIYN